MRDLRSFQSARAMSSPQKRPRPTSDEGTLVDKRSKSRQAAWDAFCDEAEAIVGKVVLMEANTDTGLATMMAAVENDRNGLGGGANKGRPYTPVERHPDDSVAACGKKLTITRAVVSLLLSTQTNVNSSAIAQARLAAAFPDGPNTIARELTGGAAAARACRAKVTDAIRVVGMTPKRLGFIEALLTTLHGRVQSGETETVDLALEPLRERDDALEQLCKIKGVGPKVAFCVLAFTCGANICPVDTNLEQITAKLNWLDGKKGLRADAIQKLLSEVVPDSTPRRDTLRRHLHCLLLQLNIQKSKKKSTETKTLAEEFVTRWAGRKRDLM